jgi:hypothetical protein
MLVSGGIMLFFRVIWAIACVSFLCSIPLKAHAEIIFDARVNNKDVKLLLDTGSEVTLLFNKTATRLKLNVIKRNSSLLAEPGKVRVDLTEECDFQLGSTKTKGRLYVYTPPDWFDAGVDGVLAWSTIRDSIFYFSMEEKRSEILDELPVNIESWSRWNIAPDKQLTIQVEKPNGNKGSIFIDTGSPYGIQLNPKRWRDWRNLHSSSPTTLTAFFSPASGLVVREECWAKRIDIERFSVKDVPLMQSSPESELNIDSFEATIGSFALRRFEIIIDGPSNNLYMKPNNLSTSQYAYNRLGAVFVPDDISGEYLYAHVVEGSPAYIAGLRNRDILTSVNDLDVTKWKTDPRVLPLSRFWSAPTGTKLKLTYSRKGIENRTSVELGEIFNP